MSSDKGVCEPRNEVYTYQDSMKKTLGTMKKEVKDIQRNIRKWDRMIKRGPLDWETVSNKFLDYIFLVLLQNTVI